MQCTRERGKAVGGVRVWAAAWHDCVCGRPVSRLGAPRRGERVRTRAHARPGSAWRGAALGQGGGAGVRAPRRARALAGRERGVGQGRPGSGAQACGTGSAGRAMLGSRGRREEKGGREKEKEKWRKEKKMGKRKKEKEKGEGKKIKRGDASAPTAAIGRAWPTGGRAGRVGTAARKERENYGQRNKGTMEEIECQDNRTKFREGIK